MPWKASGDGLPAMTGEIPQEAIEAGSRDILIGNGWALDLTAYPSGPVREGAAEEVVRAVLAAVLPLIRSADEDAGCDCCGDENAICSPGHCCTKCREAHERLRTDRPSNQHAQSVPDPVVCAACGGSGDRNGNRRAADPFGTCPGCDGTGKASRRIIVFSHEARRGRAGFTVPVGCTVGDAAWLAVAGFKIPVGPNDQPTFGLRGVGLQPSDPLPDDLDYELLVIG